MREPPKMLSTKDLMYIEDLFNMLLTTNKKITYYESIAIDSKIKQLMHEIHNELKLEYNSLLEVING